MRCPVVPRGIVPSPARRAAGFTLLNVLAAMVVLAFGLLTLGRGYLGLTAAGTQNQNLSAIAPLSNGFWGIVQANPALLTGSPALAGTYTAASIGSAPVPLQDWLTRLLAPGGLALPGGSVVIATGPDAASGAACSPAAGCTVSLTISWSQTNTANGQPAATATRSQVFNYQFGL